MSYSLLDYYAAIESTSTDMLNAARRGDWDKVVKLEGACAVLISQLKQAVQEQTLPAHEVEPKARLMRSILLNDVEIRHLAKPLIEALDKAPTLH